MISSEIKPESRHESKTRFLDAVLHAFRSKGYSAPRIEDICEAAGLTEGSFFHHFGSKDELALEAAKYWTEGTDALFASAPYGNHADPLDSLPAYMDFRKSLMRGELSNFTCLIGTLVQEDYETHPAIRDACNRGISEQASTPVSDIEEAKRRGGIEGKWTAESLALLPAGYHPGRIHSGQGSTRCGDRGPMHRPPSSLSRDPFAQPRKEMV